MWPFKWKMSELKSAIKHKNCSKCNAEFTCNDSGLDSCWCNKHQLSEKQLSFLKENYDNCLCEPCLKGFSEAN